MSGSFKSGSAFGPAGKWMKKQMKSVKTPTFDKTQAEKSQLDTIRRGTFDIDTSLGSMGTRINPDGTVSRVYGESAADQQRQGLIEQGLGGLAGTPEMAQQAFYDQQTRLLQPQMSQQTENLEEQLINQGLTPGSQQYDQRLKALRDQQAGTMSDISNKALFAGQQFQGGQIGNIGALANQRDILQLAGLSGTTGASDLYTQQFNADTAKAQAKQAKRDANMQMVGQAVGSAAGAFSDKRLKENLVKVGKLNNGLDVYVGNYKEETGLDTTPQLFLIAQEVQEVNPEAVIQDGEFLKVIYNKAVK